jgi:hypothetical protein
MRTFTRSELDAANRAWDEGDFSREWRDIRHKAAMGGLIYPPSGTKHDSWEDARPSQRAILIRAIREMPALLDRCLIGAPSWHVVITRLLSGIEDWREEVDRKELHAARIFALENPTHREAMQSIGQIVERIRGAL